MSTFAGKFCPSQLSALTFAFAAMVLSSAPSLSAHPDGLARDAQPPYPGRGHAGQALSPDENGRILDMTAENVTLLSWLSLTDLPGGNERGSDIWSHVSASGREYAIIGLDNGTAFVEITNPTVPVVADYIASPNSIWKEVTTYQQYAYVVNETEGGMQIIDLSGIDQGNVSLVGEFTDQGLSTTHTIRVNPESGYIYLDGSNLYNGGLVAVNVQDPSNPVIAGAWEESYVHDVVVVTYHSGPYAGREIAFACCGGNGLQILDVTDKSNMETLSILFYPGMSYCHYGWLDGDRKYFYINDELDEAFGEVPTTTTYIADVEDLTNPVLVTSFTNGNLAIDHNPMGRGRYLFEANYRSGLRVYEISNVNDVQEVGWFDTYAADDLPAFNGAWGVDSALPSGVILVSDIERGLFVFDVTAAGASVPWGQIKSDAVRLLPSYPNPVRETSTIGFELPRAGRASVALIDATGRTVRTLAEGFYPGGRHVLTWGLRAEAERLRSGVYFARLTSDQGESVERIVVLR